MVVKGLYLKPNKKLFYLAAIFSSICLMVGNFLFSIQHIYLLPIVAYFLMLATYLGLSYFVGVTSRKFSMRRHNMLVIGKHLLNKDVDVFLPVCGEDLAVLKNTWDGVVKMRGFKKVYVLDDGKSKLVEQMAKDYGFNYITRPTNELKKAGNLRHAFGLTSSDYILILDADFRPEIDFLEQTIPYFIEEGLAIVQTPQFFRSKPENSWIKNAAGSVQELFYRMIQVNRDSFGGAICVGTNAVYRRAALEPFGGTYPIGYSEDVHTGFQLVDAGWKIKYLPIILAEGECPGKLEQFFTQQYRWAMGSITLMLNKNFWKSKLTKMQKICYMTGMFYYVSTGFSVVLSFVPQMVMLAFFPQKVLWYNLLFSVPSFIFSVFVMKAWMKAPMTLDLLRVRQISYFAHLIALKDYLMGSLEEWKPTGAKEKSKRFVQFKVLFQALMIVPFFLNLYLIFFRIHQGFEPIHFVLGLFFLIFNFWINLKIYGELFADQNIRNS